MYKQLDLIIRGCTYTTSSPKEGGMSFGQNVTVDDIFFLDLFIKI